MRKQLLQDLIAVAANSYPLPAFSNEAETIQWVGTLSQGVTRVVYDVVLKDVAEGKLKACCDDLCTAFSDDEIEAAWNEVAASGTLKAPLEAGKVADFVAWLKTVDWAKWVSLIISIIPK